MYPHPPFAPTRGNPHAVLLQRLYEAQVTQRAVRNQLQTTEARLAAVTATVRATAQALADARRARDLATAGVRDTVLSIYKSGAAPGLYTAVESTGAPGVIRAGAQGRLATIRAAGSRAEVLDKRLADAVAERDTLTKRLTSLHDRVRQADAEVLKVLHRVADRLPDRGVRVGATTLRWPVRGEVTSGYGNRYDPYYHRWQLHAGIDIEATTGTLVRAAATGRVVQAGWFGGYGNYVCLAHGVVRGQRMTTCYGHQAGILVAEGQRIRAGEPVGRVGSTGASTGPHLHFEVRLGGRPTDPRLWL
jgi:murein DD-endopeptidase MepM/ murein hydrolase activator NlpD